MTEETGVIGEGIAKLRGVPDHALEHRLRGLIADGARTEALIVAHMGEVDARRLHARAGYHSLFEYCVNALGLSEFEAIFRISAARTVRNFPLAFELLERGEVHLSALHLLRHYLTPENHVELLNEARLKSKRQIEAIIAARFPRADVAASVRPSSTVEPLAPERFRLELTVDAGFKEKLERIRDRLSHAIPSMDLVAVLDRALDALEARLNKGRFGKPVERSEERPQPDVDPKVAAGDEEVASGTPPEQAERGVRSHIPWEVSRAVAERDEHKCTFVSPEGRRCGSRGFLQIHHDIAWARGGADTIDNLRLLCAEHNLLLAAQEFGEDVVQRNLQKTRRAAPGMDEAVPASPEGLPIPDKVA